MTQPMETPIFLLANFTAESLAMRLKSQGFNVRTAPGFDTWRMELLNPESTIWKTPTAVIFLFLYGPALFPNGISGDFTPLEDAIEVVRGTLALHADKTIVVSTLDLSRTPALPLAGHDLSREASWRWRAALEELKVPVLDLESLVADTGREAFYNAKTWYFGALPFSAQGEKRIVQEISRVVHILKEGRRKCLVLDLDGVLWGGVIGEDGLEGIALSASGIGGVYHDVQAIVKMLAKQGVLLAVCSKNNLEDAMLPFKRHPHALLREEDFATVRANWQPKPQNLAEIARELNIGLDSFVFIDDNPVEREAVRAAYPEMTVPEFPSDTSALPAFFREVADRNFTAPALSAEDAAKAMMYRAEAQRNAVRQSHASLDDYLASLSMRLDLHLLKEDEVPRAAQLCAKTNQFNLTTRRYDEAELRALMQDERWRLWIASLSDRYGDYGRIALVIAEVEGQGAAIDTFLMSCRAMGRGVETEILSWVEELLATGGVGTLEGRYLPTPKNAPVKDFWRSMGYAQNGERWIREAPFPLRKTHVTRCADSESPHSPQG
ncbi:MAG: HAD family hydrolase [Synergistaceae bacterium]|nr:HAD family hydrolase [Synergistaceae bacterium]